MGQKAANPNLKIKKNPSLNQISHMTGKQTHSSAQWANNYFTKTIEN